MEEAMDVGHGPLDNGPMPLLTSNRDEKWEVSQCAMDVLRAIDKPVSVVAIVGKYRTGKSYLMNKLAGRNSGFNLGSTIQSETKGIWMWARPHPHDSKRCLLLLDTEGLYDVEKGDQTHDMQLFTFALLLSNCMVFNTVGSIDNAFVNELQLVAELSDKIKVKRGTDAEEDVTYFRSYFPSLFVVLRDFFLDLKLNGKQITSDEYLENSLKSRKGMSRKDQQYNAPRECIRQYFQCRKCFALPKPVSDDQLLKELEKATDDDLSMDFRAKSEELLEAIIAEAKPLLLEGNEITGSGYEHIVQEYVRAINEGGVPCIESAIDVMIENECRKAYEIALQLYREEMTVRLQDKMPIDRSELRTMNADCRNLAVDMYRRKSMFEDKGPHTSTLKVLDKDIEAQFQAYMAKNNDSSVAKSRAALRSCFGQLEQDIKNSVFAMKGGHAKYLELREVAVDTYKKLEDLGPMSDTVLHEYLASREDTEQAIITADKALSDKDKEEAMLQKRLKEQDQHLRFEKEERHRLNEENQRQQRQQTELLQKMQADYQENLDKRMQSHAEATELLKRDYEDLMAKNQARQAEQFQMMIDQMDKDRAIKEQEATTNKEQMAALLEKFTAMEAEMREREEQHRKEMSEMQERMQKMGEEQRKEFLDAMEKKDKLHQEEMSKMANNLAAANQRRDESCTIL